MVDIDPNYQMEAPEQSPVGVGVSGAKPLKEQSSLGSNTVFAAKKRPLWAMQGLAISALTTMKKCASKSVKEGSNEPIKWNRLCACGRIPAMKKGHFKGNHSADPEIWVNNGKACFHKVARCGSVWVCPPCSAQIRAVRAVEAQSAVDQWCVGLKKMTSLLTLTHTHSRDDLLIDLVEAQTAALRFFWKNDNVRRALRKCGYKFRISAFEQTYGHESGWHPHRHIVLFHDVLNARKQRELYRSLKKEWIHACELVDLEVSRVDEIGVNLSFAKGGNAGTYISKFGLEVSLSDVKKAKNGRYSPWALLDKVMEEGETWPLYKFNEYAIATRGLRQLRWSPRMKAFFGVDDVEDKDIVGEAMKNEAYPYIMLTAKSLRKIASVHKRDDLLNLCGNDDRESIKVLMDGLGMGDQYGYINEIFNQQQGLDVAIV